MTLGRAVVCVNFLVEDGGGRTLVLETDAPYICSVWTKAADGCWTSRPATAAERQEAQARVSAIPLPHVVRLPLVMNENPFEGDFSPRPIQEHG